MIGYPLDSHVTYKADGSPVWDRAISSAPLRKLTKKLFSDGVLPNPSTNLQVTAVSGLVVNILSGFALCNGCQKLQEEDLEMQLPAADATYDRIDSVVLRLDDNDDVRACEFFVISGTAASTPQAPALTQSDSIWEIGLANIYRKANSTEVTNANITDTRYDTSRCGIISSISQFDTTTLYQQIEADLEEFKKVNQADFFTWFESLKNVLSEDVVANLLNMINEVKADIGSLEDLETTEKTSIVGAINELKNGLDNAKVDTLTTMEQVNASTDKSKPVGAGAVQEVYNSLGGCSLEQEGEDFFIVGADSVRKKLGKNTITFTCKGVQYYSSLQIALPANNVKRISIVENNTATYPIRVIAYTSKIGYGDSVELLKTTVGGTGELIIDDPSLYKSFRINVAVDKNDYPIDYVAEIEFV